MTADHPFAPADAEVAEEESEPGCQVDGCPRPGSVPRAVGTAPDGSLQRAYVCDRHHRLFLAAKILLVILVGSLFLLAFFRV
ncbi:hypothetical protein [Halovivax sp.]|uniref:hypothetical protein n=1 Tax=Halovivax sp. TaxID=1935978 RepID=UPI0025C47839|nr:hypothetical protein [Halovivax sp.]